MRSNSTSSSQAHRSSRTSLCTSLQWSSAILNAALLALSSGLADSDAMERFGAWACLRARATMAIYIRKASGDLGYLSLCFLVLLKPNPHVKTIMHDIRFHNTAARYMQGYRKHTLFLPHRILPFFLAITWHRSSVFEELRWK